MPSEDSTTESRNAPKVSTRQLRLAGVEIPPRPSRRELDATHAQLQRAMSTGTPNLAEMPPTQGGAIPVFMDEAGDHFIVTHDHLGRAMALPYITGEKLDASKGETAQGGFIAMDAMPKVSSTSRQQYEVLNAALTKAGKKVGQNHGWIPDLPGSSSGNNSPFEPDTNFQDAGDSLPKPFTPRDDFSPSAAHDNGSGAALQSLGQVIGFAPKLYNLLSSSGGTGGVLNFFADPGAGAANLLNGVAGMGVDQLLGMGGQMLISKLFPVDDNSSLGMQVGAELAKEMMGELQTYAQSFVMDQLASLGIGSGGSGGGGGLQEAYNQCCTVLTGSSAGRSNAAHPIARITDPTDHGGKVIEGAASVQIVGMAAARALDQHVCPKIEPGPIPHVGGKIREGNPTVLIKGLPAARLSHMAICTGCGLQTGLVPAQSTVFIGPASVAVLPPPIPIVAPPSGLASAASATVSAGGSAANEGSKSEASSLPTETGKDTSAKDGEAFQDNPERDLDKWNTPGVQDQTNCYAYAADDPEARGAFDPSTGTYNKPQPGETGGVTPPGVDCYSILDAAAADGMPPMCVNPNNMPAGYYPVALVSTDKNASDLGPRSDYHWYRQDKDGSWSHKPGTTPARAIDNSGRPIFDPQTADRGRYTEFCGYFPMPKGGLPVGIPGNHGK